MAEIVPIGMERWASAKSPDRFEPAMIPVKRKRSSLVIEFKLSTLSHQFTSHAGEVDPDEECEGGRYVRHHLVVHGLVQDFGIHGVQGRSDQLPFVQIPGAQILCKGRDGIKRDPSGEER